MCSPAPMVALSLRLWLIALFIPALLSLRLSARDGVLQQWASSCSSQRPRDNATRMGALNTGGEANGIDSNVKTKDLFSLDSIRSTLIRQEETIIFALIERAQYRANRAIYEAGSPSGNGGALKGPDGEAFSFLQWMLLETERLHAKVRRYTSPEEHPFFPAALPAPILPELSFPEILVSKKSEVDVNPEVLRWYRDSLIGRLCQAGDDEQHGSSVLCDISAMQALSRRIHYGKFVAESKFLADPDTYTRLVHERDPGAILRLLTNVEVERRVLRRAFTKASTYGQDVTGATEGYKVDPMLIAEIYRDMIIPLTKDVEVRYLFHRVGRAPPPASEYFEQCRGPADAFDGEDWRSQIALPSSRAPPRL